MILMTSEKSPLVQYLESVLEERRLSQRAFGMYSGVASSTVSRIMSGGKPDPDTLIKFAEYLNEPVENFFRLAGWLPQESVISSVLREIEKILIDMPEANAKKIRDQIRVEWEYTRTDRDEDAASKQERKAS